MREGRDRERHRQGREGGTMKGGERQGETQT